MPLTLVACSVGLACSADIVNDLDDDPRYNNLWSAPATPDPRRLPLAFGFGDRLSLGIHPFSGTGPYHFEGLSSTPYYARSKDIEYGIRLGLTIDLTESLHVGIQIPYTANPTSSTPNSTGDQSFHNGYGHVDAALGIEWSF